MVSDSIDVSCWTWQLFDRADPAQATALDALERSGRVRQRHDEMLAQIDDLAASVTRALDVPRTSSRGATRSWTASIPMSSGGG